MHIEDAENRSGQTPLHKKILQHITIIRNVITVIKLVKKVRL